jgi:CxxC-x17-CxxC domain-containing protein
MKKRTSSKGSTDSAQASPAIMGLIGAMQQQLAIMEKKIDTLINRAPERQPSERRFPTLFAQSPQRSQPPPRHEERKDNNFRDRVLHKAVCADCKKECEVPFKPSGDRPVYCKDWFSKRKASAPSFNPRVDNTNARPSAVPVHYPQKSRVSEASRPERKRKPSYSKKKKRA